MLSGCTSQPAHTPETRAENVPGKIIRLMPASVPDRAGWASDIMAAFKAQHIAPSTENICSVLAVAGQESGFQADAPVPGLGKIAWQEIDRRAGQIHIPAVVVHAALHIPSPNGQSYSERLDAVRTEKQLSAIFDDFIGMVPMGQRLFGNFNPVHTGGPMQVSISFAETHAKGYPYPVADTLRHEVFSRRGGLYFGIVHLLAYPTHYDRQIFRFADFNAGWYASRNAAFQHAVSRLSGKPLALDGDLINYGEKSPGATELAVRTLGKRLNVGAATIRRALDKGETAQFEQTDLYQRVFALADRTQHPPLPRAILPGITLHSPKITRTLTTAWFAKRVDQRYMRCLAKAGEK
ncbi:DUF1615 domain-containing protein [Acerihabitans sp. TG2]|uniref:DUF1615 domain-containing protein n=1 Tax=Acerihabitans sp. TG2 TaxID=3096008 RepID=UPI002B231D25|nr:DUF1615 domain-containing protein [Acerihabitans sp. TG2]MEA9391494.1 DUF1615 domain-containing protein [Acerihabitans sp. TG2]